MFRNLNLRTKIFAIGLPPLLILAIISAYAVLLSSRGGLSLDELSGDIRTLGMASLAALLLSALTMIVIGRSITDPVGQLKTATLEVAHERLPALVDILSTPGAVVPDFEPIPVDQDDEIGDVIRALNEIQEKVAEVANSQRNIVHEGVSELVVNLARRNQTLLDRQLELIDRLEQDEEDPERLEELFGLDHLATRMRRNAESLLVLAGSEPTRRRGSPVLICDTMRVAMSEIEDYTHVDIVDVDLAKIPSPTAMDLAHLASELLENATQFSPPDKPVEVRGSAQPDGGFVIAIIDRGIGMNPEKLQQVNAILSQPPNLGLGMSRSLGFIVVGHLARRIGVSVTLTPTPGGGTTATILLPSNDLELVDMSAMAPPMYQPSTAKQDSAPPVAPEAVPVVPEVADPLAMFVQAEQPLSQATAPVTEAAPAPVPQPLAPKAPIAQPVPAQPAPAQPVTAAATNPFESQIPAALAGTMPSKLSEAIPEGVSFDAGVDALLHPAPAKGTTASGLVKRDRTKSAGPEQGGRPVTPSSRTPEEIRDMLSRYRQGLDANSSQPTPQPPQAPSTGDQP